MFEDVEEIKPDDGVEKPLKFYYNREERIARAPKLVQDYYNGKMKPVRGFRIFFIPQNRYIFFALIFFVGAAWIYTGLNKTKAGTTIAGINCELTAFSYEEEIYVSLQMKRSKKSKSTAPVAFNVEYFVIDPNNQISDKRSDSMIYSDGEQYLRTKFTDYDIIRVDAIINADGQEKELSAQVKR